MIGEVFGGLLVAFGLYSALPLPQIEWKRSTMRYALGFLPLIVLEVCIGQSIHTPGSPQFLLALGLRLALSLGSLLVYWRKFHKAAR